MRHQYTCIFSDVLTSRVWAQPTSTRAVWLWFQLSADPEGFVPATTSGVAIGAHVSESEARAAIECLESADTDSDPDDPNEGRIIARVPRGWRVLGFEDARERARYEAQKARNRRSMQRARAALKAAANDTSDTQSVAQSDTSVDPVSENAAPVYQPKPTPKPKPTYSSSEGGGSPLPPVAEGIRFSNPSSWQAAPKVITQIPPGFVLDDELRMAAKLAGVKDADARFADLRKGPIGGARGIFETELRNYIRDTCIPKWRAWEETDRFKAGKFPGNAPTPEPAPPPRVKGMPPWVRESHNDFACTHTLNLKGEAKAFAKGHHIPPGNLQVNDAAEAFTLYLLKRAAEAA